MKKILLGLFTFVILFGNYNVLAQNETTEKVSLTKSAETKELIGNLKIYFCDPENPTKILPEPLQLQVGQLQNKELCLRIENYSDVDADVNIMFVDSTINDIGGKSCGLKSDIVKNYLFPSREGKIKVPAKNHVIKTANIKFPLGIEGTVDACMAYTSSEDVMEGKSKGGAGFVVGVETRLAKTISFFVGNVENINTDIVVKNINTKSNELNKLVLTMDLLNSGNVNGSLYITGSITNIFGFNSTFIITGSSVGAGDQTTLLATLGEIPSYKGLYNIKINIDSTPKLSFDIDGFNLDKSKIKKNHVEVSTTFFEMPRVAIGTIIVVILLLILAFRKPKQKVVYVQQPQQPTPTIQ